MPHPIKPTEGQFNWAQVLNDAIDAIADQADLTAATPGPQGPAGPTGATGPTGPQGPQGAPGTSGGSSIFVNVMDAPYSATGNGTINDQAAFQAAVNAIKAAGSGTLYIPGKNAINAPRKFLINGNVELCSNIRIISDGAWLTKTSASPYTFFKTQSNGTTGYGSGGSNIHVSGLIFKGSFDPAAPIVACAFGLHHTSNLLVENCQFVEMQGPGHCFDMGACDGVTIRKSKFIGFRYDGTYHQERAECIQVDSSYNGATSTQDPAGSYDGLLSKNIYVDNCEFLPLTNAFGTFPAPNPIGAHSFRETLKYENIQFTNNLVIDPIEQIEPRGVNKNLTGIVKFGCTDGLLVSGNRFINTTTRTTPVIHVASVSTGNLSVADPNVNPTSPQGAFAVPNTSTNIKIVNNTFSGFKMASGGTPQPIIVLQGTGADGRVDDVLIHGNSFRDSYATATEAGEAAIYSQYVSRLRVTSNGVSNFNSTVYINNCVDVKINSNDISDTYSYPLWSTASTGVLVTGNSVVRYRKPMQTDANSGDINFIGNNFREPLAAVATDNTGIVISGSKQFLVAMNNFTNLGTALTRAIFAGNGAVNGLIVDNFSTGFTDTAVSGGVANTNVIFGKTVQASDLAGSTLVPPRFDPFTATGTWTKTAGATRVRIVAIGGGGGGGSGRQGAAATVRCGGGGAGGSGYSVVEYDAADLPATLDVSIGSGGAGAAAVATADTNGSAGANGGHTFVGPSISTSYAVAMGGFAGAGGTATTGTNGAAGSGQVAGAAGGSASTTGGVGGNASSTGGAGAGGAGGGITTGNVAAAGGTGSGSRTVAFVTTAGGVVGGALPVVGVDPPGKGQPGTGGGGGAASITAAAQAGANGAGWGAGGGGGGASLNTFASGKGGNGTPGYVLIVTEYY